MRIDLSEDEMHWIYTNFDALRKNSIHKWMDLARIDAPKDEIKEQFLITQIHHRITYLFGRALGLENDPAADALINEGYDEFESYKRFKSIRETTNTQPEGPTNDGVR